MRRASGSLSRLWSRLGGRLGWRLGWLRRRLRTPSAVAAASAIGAPSARAAATGTPPTRAATTAAPPIPATARLRDDRRWHGCVGGHRGHGRARRSCGRDRRALCWAGRARGGQQEPGCLGACLGQALVTGLDVAHRLELCYRRLELAPVVVKVAQVQVRVAQDQGYLAEHIVGIRDVHRLQGDDALRPGPVVIALQALVQTRGQSRRFLGL